jgi:hypothetical protein
VRGRRADFAPGATESVILLPRNTPGLVRVNLKEKTGMSGVQTFRFVAFAGGCKGCSATFDFIQME